MLKTNLVIDLLKDNQKLSYDKIWTKVKAEVMAEAGKSKDQEITVKNDLYLAMLQDEKLIMVGNNNWALRNQYTQVQIKNINENLLGEELNKAESDVEDDEKDILAEVEEQITEEEE